MTAARYLVPIPGLTVPGPWPVGKVTLHPIDHADYLLAGAPPAKFRDGGDIGPEIDRIIEAAAGGTIADVREVASADEALAAVRIALDALRLFAASRRITRTLPFGLPGDLAHGIVHYISIGVVAAPGWARAGEPVGGGFDQTDHEASGRISGVQVPQLGDRRSQCVAQRERAAIGAQLFSRAAIEQRPDIKMLGVVATLEAWLLTRGNGPQTHRLARRVSWFGCGRHDDDLCGRSRPVCPYLRLQPGRDGAKLTKLRTLGNTYAPWRCSEWHRVMDWYDARSDTAHGADPADVEEKKEADSAEFWVARYLAEPILDWLRTHPDDPLGALDTALDEIPEPTDWAAMVAALDADPSPPSPPLSL